MANYHSDGKKPERIATKCEQALRGALKHQASASRLLLLAQRLKEAKIRAAIARGDTRVREKWEGMSIDDVLREVAERQ